MTLWSSAAEKLVFWSWLVCLRVLRVLWPIDVHHQWSDTTAFLQVEVPRGYDKVALDLLQITDAHISEGPLTQDERPYAERMHSAFVASTSFTNGSSVQPISVFRELVDLAAIARVDVLALSGDILNFPQARTAEWVVQTLNGNAGNTTPYIYCAGNHDWFPEGANAGQRELQLQWRRTALQPLYEGSATWSGPTAGHYDFGAVVLGGILLLTIDNSRYQVTEEQVAFFRGQLLRWLPTILILHVPLSVKEQLRPFQGFALCGDPAWGEATDRSWTHERRARWPRSGNSRSTELFLEAVLAAAAPQGPLIAVLAGHVHAHDETPFGEDASSEFPETSTEHSSWGAVQYIGLGSFNGGHRMLSASSWSSGSGTSSATFRQQVAEQRPLTRASQHLLIGFTYIAWDVPLPIGSAPLRALAWKCWGGVRGEEAAAAMVDVNLVYVALETLRQRTLSSVRWAFEALAHAFRPLLDYATRTDEISEGADGHCTAEVGEMLRVALPIWADPLALAYEPGLRLELLPGCSILHPLNQALSHWFGHASSTWAWSRDWLHLGAGLVHVMAETDCRASAGSSGA